MIDCYDQKVLLTKSLINLNRIFVLSLDARNLNSAFITECRSLVNVVKTFLQDRNRSVSLKVVEEFKKASAVLRTHPKDSEALVELITFTKQFKRVKLRQLNSQCVKIRSELEFLFSCDFLVEKECLAWIGQVAKWRKQIEGDIVYALNQADLERKKLESAFFKRLNEFEVIYSNAKDTRKR